MIRLNLCCVVDHGSMVHGIAWGESDTVESCASVLVEQSCEREVVGWEVLERVATTNLKFIT